MVLGTQSLGFFRGTISLSPNCPFVLEKSKAPDLGSTYIMLNYRKFVKGYLFLLFFVSIFSRPTSAFDGAGGIIINEILPSPEGPDDKEEWIEIFNQNEFEVVLSGWQIKDMAGKIKTYTLRDKTTISPKGFLVFPRPETKITLNNDGDGLILSGPSGEILDRVKYESAPLGESYNRKGAEWAWSEVLTPGNINVFTKEKPKLNTGSQEALAAIGEHPKSFLPLFIALALALLSGAIILIMKKRLEG